MPKVNKVTVWRYKESLLPDEYQEVEYIESSGTQYIDTGYKPTSTIKVEVKMGDWSASVERHGSVFGSRDVWSTTSGNAFQLGYDKQGGNYTAAFGKGYGNSSYTNRGIIDAGTHIIEQSQNGIYVDNSQKFTFDTYTFSCPVNMYIFALNDNGTVAESGSYKLYYFKIYNSGTLVKKFVPCYRKSDNVIGLYDLIEKQFYTNAGTGSFTKGSNINKLPSAYQRVEYIQSTATNPGTTSSSGQYINTGVTVSKDLKIEMDMQFTVTSVQQRLFGGGYDQSETSGVTFDAYINGGTQWARAVKNGTGDWMTTNISANTNRNKFVLDNSRYIIYDANGGIVYNAANNNTITNTDSWAITLLARNYKSQGTIVCHSSAKVYGCKMRNSGVLVRYFIPCYRKSDNIIGLYDAVNNQFYTNSGTGTFTKGADILDMEEIQIYPFNPTPVTVSFSYTGSDQHWTVPKTGTYLITAKGAGGRSAKGGLASGKFQLTKGDELSIMVGANGGNGNGTKYGFGGSANGGSNAAGGGLSGVFTGSGTITSSDSARALVIGGGAGGNSAGTGGAGGGTTGGTGTGSYGTAGAGGTQTGRGSGGNAGSGQFQGGNGSGTYGYGGGGGWWGGNGSIGDSSADDDKGGGGGSGYVASSGTDAVLTQGGGANAGSNGSVTIEKV